MSTQTRDDGPLRYFEWNCGNHKPHWLRYGDGWARMEVRTHQGNRYLSFYTDEHGDKSDKRTMVTLKADEALQFYQWLKQQFEPAKVDA